MRFMSIYKPGYDGGKPPAEETMAAMTALIEEMTEKGVFIDTGGLQASTHGARVKISNGKITVTDGPFAETKELIGGYAIFEMETLEEAVRWTKRFLEIMSEGECEIRAMYEPGAEECAARETATVSAEQK